MRKKVNNNLLNILIRAFKNKIMKFQLMVNINLNLDFSNNLTFKTLSLGFYITAGDIWTKTFKKYHQDIIEEKLNNFHFTQDKKFKYFATLDTITSKWTRQN